MTIAPTLNTDRLTLAPLSLDQWEAYAVAWADERMTTFIGGKPRARQESWNKFILGAGLWSVLGYGYWTFLDRETGTYLGNGGLARFERGIDELEGYPEAGWAFVPDAWGKGLATEAMAAVMQWADERLAAEIRCIIDHDNVASQKVAAKLGFQHFADSEGVIGQVGVYRRPQAAAV